MSTPALTPRRFLADEIARSEWEMNLARASLLVEEQYPQLSVDRHDEALEQLSGYLRCSPDADDARRVEGMLRELRAGITPRDYLEGL